MAIQLSGSLEILGNIIASGGFTGSFSGSATSASYASTLQGLGSASFAPAGTFNTVSQSFATTSGSIASRVNVIETSYATTGSNNFTKPQQISDVSNAISFTSTASLYTDGGLRVKGSSFVSGTAYFNDVVVYGTSSIEYITSSQLAIGTNIITLNTDTPSVRFGGISVFDSGSNNLSTGSLFWDSEKDKWIYSNPSASTYDGGMLISGPRNSSGLGNEVGTTSCALMMGQGGDHITSSAIFSYGNATCFYGNSYISSNGAACLASTICSPGMDIMPSGIGSSTLGGIMRVVTTGTSAGIAVGQSNANRYTHIAANDIQVFNDDFFLSTRCAFPLSIGTCYTARLTFAATGIACFACQICTTSAALSGNVIFNRASTSAGNNIEWRTASTLNWYIGTRGLVNNNFYIVNEGLSTNNLILDATTGATTINTTSTTALSVQSTGTASGLQLRNTGGTTSDWIIQSDGGVVSGQAALRFYSITASAYRMSIDGSGNVGIGTTSPCERFEVAGITSMNIRLYGRSGVAQNNLSSNIYYNGTAWTRDNLSYGAQVLRMDTTNGNFYVDADTTTSGYPATRFFICGTNGSTGIGTTSTSAEANLFLGAQGSTEGGQLVLQKGTSCSCATHLDNYQDSFRIMSGTDTGSTTVRFSVDMKNGSTYAGTNFSTAPSSGTTSGQAAMGVSSEYGGTSWAINLATVFPNFTFSSRALSVQLQILGISDSSNGSSVLANAYRSIGGTWALSTVNTVTNGSTFINSITASGTTVTINWNTTAFGAANITIVNRQ